MPNKLNQNQGFALIELMVILFIIALISSIVLVNYRRGEKQYILNSQVQALAQFIREAQNMAMGMAVTKGLLEVPAGGYGIAFLNTSQPPYLPILYADLNNNKEYDSGDSVIKQFDLNPILKISTITGRTDYYECRRPSKVYINFSPPDPITEITGVDDTNSNCGYSQISISLKLKDESLGDKIIEVSNTGYINIH